MSAIKILNNDGFLNFSAGKLASVEDFESADRCVGSIFESLKTGEIVQLIEINFFGEEFISEFELDEDLDLIHPLSEKEEFQNIVNSVAAGCPSPQAIEWLREFGDE